MQAGWLLPARPLREENTSEASELSEKQKISVSLEAEAEAAEHKLAEEACHIKICIETSHRRGWRKRRRSGAGSAAGNCAEITEMAKKSDS